MHAFNPSTGETSLVYRAVLGQPELHRSPLSQTPPKKRRSERKEIEKEKKKKPKRTGKSNQWLRTLATLTGDLDSVPSTHMAVHNCYSSSEGSSDLF